ncbi:unnamed protein product [Effrenium voratum]|nr:unnamed protein product [Effrenium voratum]CAJ1440826.1 unnamed protein product [Effrenium voratum]
MREKDEDELSDSARAALQIQQEIDGGTFSPKRSDRKKPKPNDGTRGAVTGIALGEYAHNAHKKDAPQAHIKVKGSKAGILSESLESLAYRAGSDDEAIPEAPTGSFRRKDLEQEERDRRAGNKATMGLDGKVYDFIDGPDDEASSGKDKEDKSNRKSKKEKTKKKDEKKKKKKKDKKKKDKKRKRSSSSSDS